MISTSVFRHVIGSKYYIKVLHLKVLTGCQNIEQFTMWAAHKNYKYKTNNKTYSITVYLKIKQKSNIIT